MGVYVFTYKKESYPNIHGHAENYKGGVLKAYSGKNSFNKIKARYLETLKR